MVHRKLSLFVLAAALAAPIAAQCETDRLTVLPVMPLSMFGRALSMDGDHLAVGAWGDDRVHTFERGPEGWAFATVLEPTTTLKIGFGWSVALAGDWLLVGAPYEDVAGADSGAVHAFERVGSAWVERAVVTPSDASPFQRLGTAVALHGTTAVIAAGGPVPNPDPGAVYVFERTGSSWTEIQRFEAFDGTPDDGFGHSVAIRDQVFVVGAPRQDGFFGVDSGAAYVFDSFDGD